MDVEKIIKIDIKKREKYIRKMFDEINRIMKKIMEIGKNELDIGEMKKLLWLFEESEKMMEFYESVYGERMNDDYVRKGGVNKDMKIGIMDEIYEFIRKFGESLDEVEDMMKKKRIWVKSKDDIGIVQDEDEIKYGLSGVMMSGYGIKWDLSK